MNKLSLRMSFFWCILVSSPRIGSMLPMESSVCLLISISYYGAKQNCTHLQFVQDTSHLSLVLRFFPMFHKTVQSSHFDDQNALKKLLHEFSSIVYRYHLRFRMLNNSVQKSIWWERTCIHWNNFGVEEESWAIIDETSWIIIRSLLIVI